jgi:hypothetical protein
MYGSIALLDDIAIGFCKYQNFCLAGSTIVKRILVPVGNVFGARGKNVALYPVCVRVLYCVEFVGL